MAEVDTTTRLKWAYGVTSTTARLRDLLPRTLKSLAVGGFDRPRLFVDQVSPQDREYIYRKYAGYELTLREPGLRIFGNWVLALWELYVRAPNADRYALFQDDFITYPNLIHYLERCDYPALGYWNLYTFPRNEKLAANRLAGNVGWYPSNQLGKGALALVFSRDAVTIVLGHDHMVHRPKTAGVRGWKGVDGGIVSAFKKSGWKEYVHLPSLVQHTGARSTLGNGRQALAPSFRGENFDAMSLLGTLNTPGRPPAKANTTDDDWIAAALGCVERRRRIKVVQERGDNES